MNKKIIMSLLVIFTFIFSGCSCSKDDLKSKNMEIIKSNEELKESNSKYEGIEDIFNFYNSLTTKGINSFVLVESKNTLTSKTLYSNGVVIASSGNDFFVLVDYSAIAQTGIGIQYRVMDINASVHSAVIATYSDAPLFDEESGLMMIKVSHGLDSQVVMKPAILGDNSDLLAYISSVKQINKIQLTDNIKTSTIDYNNTSYNSCYLDNINFDNGTLLVNTKYELTGIYLSKLNRFIDSNLIKAIVYSIYSITL